jgi:hypothetical protein
MGAADTVVANEGYREFRPFDLPEVTAEDLEKHGAAALRMMYDLAPGEFARWADLVNTAASMSDIEGEH